MFCWNCGHKNPENNKFCGECGKMQVRPPVLVESDLLEDKVRTMNPPAHERRHTGDPVAPKVNVRREAVEPEKVYAPAESLKAKEPVTQAVVPPPGTGITPTPPPRMASTNPLIGESRAVRESPLQPPPVTGPIPPARTAALPANRISGPSFLGLSDAPESSDYLLEDETPERSSTARSYIFLTLLLLFGVLIYKQWDTVTAIGRDLAKTATATAPSTIPEKPSPSEVATNTPPPQDEAVAKPESDAAPAEAESVPETTEQDAVKKETSPPAPKASAKAEEAKPEEAPAAKPIVTDDSQLELAQKYLQGRGVAQDCNRGVSLLRSAASQPNPKAQIKLGALYATGYCVSQDKAEAYRWFAQAHELQPSNQWIDKSLNSLWSEMTAEERARAQR